MARSKTTKNLFDRKPKRLVQLTHPALREAIGEPEMRGCWFVYGFDKNGKTTFTLMLAQDIAINEKVAYISAEEGTDKSFIDACRRAGIREEDHILWDEYMSIEEIVEKYSKPKTPRVIVIDNLTMYQDEMKPSELKKNLVDKLPNKLFILLGHEERGLPYPAIARMASKVAKVIFHVVGLKAFIVSRYGIGGEIVINEEKAELYWGGGEN